MEEKKITVRIPKELYSDFKIELFKRDEKMKDVIADLIKKYIEEK